MNKEEVVKLFLERGMTLEPEALEYLYNNPRKTEEVIQNIDQFGQSITYSKIQSVLQQQISIEPLKQLNEMQPKTISTFYISKLLIGRYEKFKEHLVGRMELVNMVSINKITDRSDKFSLIVMVKSKDEKNRSVDVEDLTGETTVYFSDDDKRFDLIVSDEVVGMFCERNNRIEVINLIWPDIPLKRTISVTDDDIHCLFLSDVSDEENTYDKIIQKLSGLNGSICIFFIGEFTFSDQFKSFLDSLPTSSVKIFISKNRPDYSDAMYFAEPTLLKISGSVVLLLCDGKRFQKYKDAWSYLPSMEILLNILKKRHLSPEFDIAKSGYEEVLLIDVVPDIFVSGNIGEAGLANYKGTTIVENGSFNSQPIYYMINLKTRESIKIDLS